MIEGIHKGGAVLMDHRVKVGERKEWKMRLEWVVDKRKGGWDKGFHEVKTVVEEIPEQVMGGYFSV